MSNRLTKGQIGESIASNLLRRQGYTILETNFRVRFGEIDIIALDGDTLVFVEVKARWSDRFGAPEEAVTFRKLRIISKVASYYKTLHPELPSKMRVDVVAISRGMASLIKNVY